VPEDPITQELRVEQFRREDVEREQADAAPDEQAEAQHERRADKAAYLREKLDDRAEAEKRATNEED